MSRRDNGKLASWIPANLRICRLNETYDLCKTYPSKLYSPATASDQIVQVGLVFCLFVCFFLLFIASEYLFSSFFFSFLFLHVH
jgi:hypothetical protein